MRVERTMVAMRDGVRISVCVYRPDDAARVPALFAASPYQHGKSARRMGREEVAWHV